MEYQDLRERFQVLSNVQLPPAKDVAVERVLQLEIEKYRARPLRMHRRSTVWRRVGTVTAAVAVVAIAVGMVTSHRPSAPSNTVAPVTAQGNIQYTAKNKADVAQQAQAVNVTPYLPYEGPSADQLQDVKATTDGEPRIVLTYKQFTVQEQAVSADHSGGTGISETVYLKDGTKAFYNHFNNQRNIPVSLLFVQLGNTYITIQGTGGDAGPALNKEQMLQIANSLKPLK